MASIAFLSSMRGRPPLGLGITGGNSGSICSQMASESLCASFTSLFCIVHHQVRHQFFGCPYKGFGWGTRGFRRKGREWILTQVWCQNTKNSSKNAQNNAKNEDNNKDIIINTKNDQNNKKNSKTNPNTNHNNNPTLLIKDTKNNIIKKITPDIVIGADGALSPTAKAYNFYHKERKNYYGIQAVVKGNFDKNTFKTYFNSKICPDLFAWIVPESKTRARVGLASQTNPKKKLDNFIEKYNFKLIEMQAGTIPIYSPKQALNKDNCYLVGDASTFVKATTLGGIIPGLKQAKILVDSINNNKNYSQECKKIAKSLKLHLIIRKIFNKFNDKDWNKLISYTNQPKIKQIFATHTRENPLPLITKTLLKEPRYLYFIKYLF